MTSAFRKLQGVCFLLPALLLSVAGSTTGEAKPAPLDVLNKLQPGLWQLKTFGDRADRQMCVDNGRQLIQIRHAGESCSQFIVEDTTTAATVQYTCRGTGYGRTRIRFEQPSLVQINTQGIQRGLPFDMNIEARRIGPCGR